MKKFILTMVIVVIALAPFGVTKAFACGGWFEASCNDQNKNEARQVDENTRRLQVAVPLPVLKASLERKNIKRRLELFSDENKVSYIYLTSYGRVMAFYTVKGKITSGSKRLTRTEMLTDADGDLGQIGEQSWTNNIMDTSAMTTEAPELDGTFGSSSPYIFFWTTDGTYVQWSGEYMLADQPLKLTTQPELVREIQ